MLYYLYITVGGNMRKPNKVVSMQTYRFALNYANPTRAYHLLKQLKNYTSNNINHKYSVFVHNSKIIDKLDQLIK